MLVVAVIIAACTVDPVAVLRPEALEIGVGQRVWVATNRVPDPAALFSSKRATGLQFLELQVSVPPDRKIGEIDKGKKRPSPEKHFLFASRRDFASAKEFRRQFAKGLSSKSSTGREVVIFVHGYNNTFADGVFRAAQMAADFNLPGEMVHFSWPSAANPLGYTYDRDSVLIARDGLEQLLRELHTAGARKILLVGHSLGTMLVMETLRQIEIADKGWAKRALSGVVLISPDIDVTLFNAQAGKIAQLPQPFAIFTSQKDRALRLSALINGDKNRLGSLDDPKQVAHLPVTLLDVSSFSSGRGIQHFTTGTSPALIALLRRSVELNKAFQSSNDNRTGILPGVVIRAQKATQLVLSPGVVVQ